MSTPLQTPSIPRANVLGVGVHAIDVPSAVDSILATARSGQKGYVCVTGAHAVMEAQRDPEYREILNGSLLTTPDGMPTVWMGRAQGFGHMRRVYGPDLMLAICEQTAGTDVTHFLYGGVSGSAERLAELLTGRFPGLRIVGSYTPPFRPLTEGEEQDFIGRVAASGPSIVWVGIGAPKQERFMARYLPLLSTNVMIGVGAAFDMHVGRTRQAPRWMQENGLEWFYRMLQEPRRLGPRYASVVPAFLWHAGLQTVGLKRYRLPS